MYQFTLKKTSYLFVEMGVGKSIDCVLQWNGGICVISWNLLESWTAVVEECDSTCDELRELADVCSMHMCVFLQGLIQLGSYLPSPSVSQDRIAHQKCKICFLIKSVTLEQIHIFKTSVYSRTDCTYFLLTFSCQLPPIFVFPFLSCLIYLHLY